MNLKTLRLKAEMTQREMADKLGIPYNTYISYEYGYRNPSKFARKHIELVTRELLAGNSPKVASVNIRKLIKKEDKNESKTSTSLY